MKTFKQLREIFESDLAEGEKKGLYYYVNRRKKLGISRPASSPKAPTDQAWADSAKTAKHESLEEKWSQKYKSSINCSHPKGFSQRAHCAGKRKQHESQDVMELICPDCGLCQTHGNMSINEIRKGQKDANGVTKCWPGKHAEGTKTGKNGGQVRNCVPVDEQSWKSDHQENQPETSSVPRKAGWIPKKFKIDIAKRFNRGVREETAAWTRKAGKNPTGGLNKKGIDSYRREHPGSHLSLAVTTPPSKLDPKGKAAGRRRSFCARMGGSKGPMKKPNGEPTRKALALRKWHC